MIEGGAGFIQIREKSAPSDEFYAAVADCIEIGKATGTKIIVNDRVDIAIAAGAHGVHLGQKDLPPEEARKLLGSEAILGFSTHDLEQVDEALSAPIDYIAFGPIFPTRTKKDPDPVVGLNLLKKVKLMVGELPLVAIGGIKRDNLNDVFSAGADSAAVIGDLYSGPETLGERFALLTSAVNVKHL